MRLVIFFERQLCPVALMARSGAGSKFCVSKESHVKPQGGSYVTRVIMGVQPTLKYLLLCTLWLCVSNRTKGEFARSSSSGIFVSLSHRPSSSSDSCMRQLWGLSQRGVLCLGPQSKPLKNLECRRAGHLSLLCILRRCCRHHTQ